VSRAIEKKINCENCKKILYINTSDNSSNRSRKLLSQKDRGGLYKPSDTIMKICLETERVFRSYYNVKNYKQSVLFLTTQVKMNLYQYKISFQLSGCDDNHSIVDTHKDQLTKLVIQKYLDIRMFHEIRKRNDQTKIRSKYTKLILFKNQ